jgi:hypothetical protein
VLRAARVRAVTQVLFGFAHDGGDAQRVKLYLQFHPRAASAAQELASRMLSRPLFATSLPLHLLCLDLAPGGLVGAKLYYVMERLRLDDTPVELGASSFLAAVRESGVAELRDVLRIHRVGARDEARGERPDEIDFSLPDNDLRWQDVRALPPMRALLADAGAASELVARFRVAPRRLSVSTGELRKVNLYYVLAEVERGAADAPGAGIEGRRSACYEGP